MAIDPRYSDTAWLSSFPLIKVTPCNCRDFTSSSNDFNENCGWCGVLIRILFLPFFCMLAMRCDSLSHQFLVVNIFVLLNKKVKFPV